MSIRNEILNEWQGKPQNHSNSGTFDHQWVMKEFRKQIMYFKFLTQKACV
jgi:hypothetical protein